MAKWEYRCLAEESSHMIQEKLNSLGREGWRLVFSAVFPNPVVQDKNLGAKVCHIATMERKVPEPAEPVVAEESDRDTGHTIKTGYDPERDVVLGNQGDFSGTIRPSYRRD